MSAAAVWRDIADMDVARAFASAHPSDSWIVVSARAPEAPFSSGLPHLSRHRIFRIALLTPGALADVLFQRFPARDAAYEMSSRDDFEIILGGNAYMSYSRTHLMSLLRVLGITPETLLVLDEQNCLPSLHINSDRTREIEV